jgi:hypothetical protein
VLANTLAYPLQSGLFGVANPAVEVKRVEVWETSSPIDRITTLLSPGSREYADSSQAGWQNWGGVLYLSLNQEIWLDHTINYLKVQGWRPFVRATSDGQTLDLPYNLEMAARKRAKLEALERLGSSRDLFKQWQQSPNNTDVTPASFMSQLSAARQDWRIVAQQLHQPHAPN